MMRTALWAFSIFTSVCTPPGSPSRVKGTGSAKVKRTVCALRIDIISPVIAACQQQGMAVQGPYPADTLFQPFMLQHADAVLAMYHDQGLPVLKHASFGHGINVTLGLPLIRTSVDHGTALDLAGSGRADDGSLHAALALAETLALRRSAG